VTLASTPAKLMRESSQRRSAARLGHSSSRQWAFGKLFLICVSLAPSVRSFAS